MAGPDEHKHHSALLFVEQIGIFYTPERLFDCFTAGKSDEKHVFDNCCLGTSICVTQPQPAVERIVL